MSISDLQRVALHLPAPERVHLVELLLESLDQLPEDEVQQLWLLEARRRVDEVDHGEIHLDCDEGG